MDLSVPSSFIYRSDVLGSYSSSPSSESASIKYIDEDITTVTDSTTFEHLETSAEIHPVPKAIEPGIILSILEVKKLHTFMFWKMAKTFVYFTKTTAATWSVNKIIPVFIALPVSPNMSQSQYDL